MGMLKLTGDIAELAMSARSRTLIADALRISLLWLLPVKLSSSAFKSATLDSVFLGSFPVTAQKSRSVFSQTSKMSSSISASLFMVNDGRPILDRSEGPQWHEIRQKRENFKDAMNIYADREPLRGSPSTSPSCSLSHCVRTANHMSAVAYAERGGWHAYFSSFDRSCSETLRI